MGRLTPELFAILAPMVEDACGLHYTDNDRSIFESKVQAQAEEEGFDSLLDYYYMLRYDPRGPAALAALVDALVVNETYFFREAEPLRVTVDRALARAAEEDRRARIWCAASSTGEEPLTAAMMLDARDALGRCEIVASDISGRVLAAAERGSYGARAVRVLPAEARARWFEVDRDHVIIAPRLRAAVSFCRVNLLEDGAVAALGTFDAILCRNVLIYFSDDRIAAVVQRLHRALRPGGYLVVGASESLLRFGTLLQCEEHEGVFLYRRGEP